MAPSWRMQDTNEVPPGCVVVVVGLCGFFLQMLVLF